MRILKSKVPKQNLEELQTAQWRALERLQKNEQNTAYLLGNYKIT
jgi:hypothetical protein